MHIIAANELNLQSLLALECLKFYVVLNHGSNTQQFFENFKQINKIIL